MSRYLETIRAERYGGQENREVGPFDAGLNIVHGPNEAGKSTMVSLVRGVLFGWEEAHGVRNTYHPATGGRAGELTWRSPAWETAPGESPRVSLARTEGGTAGDASGIVDIDQQTFDTIFSLTTDELGSLRNSSDVTARLLTAGSGMAADPASAFVEIERRIANTGVYQLSSDLDEKREQVKKAVERERLLVQEDRELRELKASRAVAAEHVAAVEAELDNLMEARAELAAAENRAARLTEERDRLNGELAELSAQMPEGGSVAPELLNLDSAEDRVLVDRLDELSDEQEKIDRLIDSAKENSATSSAAYEALRELDEDEVAASRQLRNRPGQASISLLLPIAFIASGITLFVHGRQINSLSITALGVSLVVVAVFLAVAAFIVLFRQPKGAEQLEARRQDAQWVMLQDKKKLDACLAEREEFNAKANRILNDAGLAQAAGSIRQAKALLEEARELRAARAEEAQKGSALGLRIHLAEKELEEIAELRTRISELAGASGAQLGEGAVGGMMGHRSLLATLDTLIREKTAQRDALVDAASDMSERLGELSHELAAARADRSTDQLKLEYHQIRTRLREEKHELITLLLARRMLERSIATWENQGQPEVYAQAGLLLDVITDGRWVGVSTSQTGSLIAIGADGTERDPRHLSLGTCQQLYLALRLALLITVEDVGRAIPVLVDDVLVNFDSVRRRGAAKALAELARHRQVIVFTCHSETVAALCAADPSATCINLSPQVQGKARANAGEA